MNELIAVLEAKDTLDAELVVGKEYYKGNDGIPGKDGKDGSDQVYIGADEPTDERVKLWIDTDATPSSEVVSWDDVEDKPEIPAPYELPVASATTLGGIKVGVGLDITNGVLSATGDAVATAIDWSNVQNKPAFADVATSGDYNDLSNKPTIPSVEGLASEVYVNEKVAAIDVPEIPTNVSAFTNDAGYLTKHQSLVDYALKSEIPAPYTLPIASTSTLGGVKVDGSTITIADGIISAISGGSSGGVSGYYFDPTATLTNDDKLHIIEIWNNKNIPVFIGQYSVIRMFMAAGYMYFCVLSPNGSVSNDILVYTLQVTNAAELKITSDKFIINQSYSLLTNTDGGNVLTSNNWQNYISIGGSGDWNYTNDIWDSNLYNAKELIFVMGNSGSNMVDSVQCYYNFSKDSAGGETTLGGSFTNCRYYLKTESGNIYWEYTGSVMNVYNNSESYYFLYKT